MTSTKLDIDFAELFQGRTDAVGLWSGGCERKPVSIQDFTNHLNGSKPIGIYPLTQDSTVRWGCSDIDVPDLEAARNLQKAFLVKGIHSFIEKTPKGFHIWVFASEWVAGTTMRRAFLTAHQVIGLPAKEVNPKQEIANDLGNYVRLPYPGGRVTSAERYFLTIFNNPFPIDQFIPTALMSRVTTKDLQPLANLWVPPTPPKYANISLLGDVQAIANKMGGYTTKLWREGPLDGGDRSNVLCRLAYRLHDEGLNANEAFTVVKDADKRWGKFHSREDGDEQLLKIVRMAYGE